MKHMFTCSWSGHQLRSRGLSLQAKMSVVNTSARRHSRGLCLQAQQPLHGVRGLATITTSTVLIASSRLPAAGVDIDGLAEDYVFKPNNPFMADMHSFAKAKSLFRHGILSEAAYALEAEVQRQPNNVDAWRLLGTVHAENDDDTQAISAMARALKADPTNAEVAC